MTNRALEGLRVLLLEDEFLISMDVEQICRDAGCAAVVTFGDLSEFDRSLIENDRIDLAIIDVLMGDGLSVPLAKDLQARRIPFIFATGLSQTEETFLEFPGVPVVTKPYATDQIVDALQAALANTKTLQAQVSNAGA